MDLRSKIILIYGPTASGKSSFAVQLAKKIKGEIINADSMQVYKELNVITSRPFKEDLKKAKHHLYGFKSVRKNFSTGEWLKLANQKILELKKRDKIPIFVGGTGLYFKALTDGMVSIPAIPIKLRNRIRSLYKNLGSKKFFLKLIKMDPLIKNRIHPSDTQRLIRAYEVKLHTKKSIYEWFSDTKSNFRNNDFYKVIIDFPRNQLIERIKVRVKSMIKDGAVLEVKKFIKLKIPKSNTASKAIGIDEIRDHLKKNTKITEVIEKMSIKTRQYAKRQMTWSRGNMKGWRHLNSKNLKNFLNKIY